jgi:hypothetical protein
MAEPGRYPAYQLSPNKNYVRELGAVREQLGSPVVGRLPDVNTDFARAFVEQPFVDRDRKRSIEPAEIFSRIISC